ncbi:MAG: 23S rRNA (pseudouridine(1915)-N(3))-methyltransferase RlmH [Mariprofundaceae bacterium]|nr:23S rRNA (pseudouridine(1915)-N(3))-methyltransferase RlmH [Mariprofundaceae bacterium]
MKLRLLVVGRTIAELSGYEARMLKRLKGQASFEVVELPEGKGRQVSQRRQEEERHILKTASPDFILFDERGKSITSMQWAEHLEKLHGNACLDFVIGGASGVTDGVRQAAGGCWSLSALTMPHQLARIVVVEQIYRAFTILQGHPYHRE